MSNIKDQVWFVESSRNVEDPTRAVATFNGNTLSLRVGEDGVTNIVAVGLSDYVTELEGRLAAIQAYAREVGCTPMGWPLAWAEYVCLLAEGRRPTEAPGT
jgi:hypothetical protein